MTGKQILTIQTGTDYRIICISDIHGNLDLLEMLLDKLEPAKEDIFIFLGDYAGKGSHNEGVLDLLIQLTKRPNTYFLQGNHDSVNNWLIRHASAEETLDFISWQPNTLLCELAAKEGMAPITRDNLSSIRERIIEKYSGKLDWLVNNPIALETESFIFAHAGLEERSDWKNSDPWRVIRNDGFLRSGVNCTEKWLVVGHWPTYNIFEAGPSNNPVIFDDRRIVGIDGGCNTKNFAQLNAFILNCADGQCNFSNVFSDSSPVTVITGAYVPEKSENFLKDTWPDFELEVLETGEYFSLCRLKASGRVGLVKNEHIVTDDSGNHRFGKNSVSNQLQVGRGEKVYILDDRCKGFALVKNMKGIMGWVPWEVLG